MKLRILHRTKNYIAIHKPSGFLVYGNSKEEQKISAKKILEEQIARPVYSLHRLDKETCGILVFSLDQNNTNVLSDLFKRRAVAKKYMALCHGEILGNQVIDIPLKRHKLEGTERALSRVNGLRTYSLQLNGEERQYALAEIEIETGRYHQIRRHLKLIKHPIVGDSVYGNSWNNDQFRLNFKIQRTLLSAVEISFKDPWTKQKVHLKSQPDEDFLNLLNKLKTFSK